MQERKMDLFKNLTLTLDEINSIKIFAGIFHEKYNQPRVSFAKDIFALDKPSKVSIEDYLMRLMNYSPQKVWNSGEVEIEDFLICMHIYLDRYQKKSPIHDHNIHQLILTAYLFANKMHLDKFYSNAFVAKIGGISPKTLLQLDRSFCEMLDFDFFIKPEDYDIYRQNNAVIKLVK